MSEINSLKGNTDVPLEEVIKEIESRGRGALERRLANVFRRSIDEILDGPRTKHFDSGHVSGPEKSHLGAKVEIIARAEFDFGKGRHLDYLIAGHEVDAKFSAPVGAALGIPHIRQGEWISVTVHPAEPEYTAPIFFNDGVAYRVAKKGDIPVTAPKIPNGIAPHKTDAATKGSFVTQRRDADRLHSLAPCSLVNYDLN